MDSSILAQEVANDVNSLNLANAVNYDFSQSTSALISSKHLQNALVNYTSLFSNKRIKLFLLTVKDRQLFFDIFTNEKITQHTGGLINVNQLNDSFEQLLQYQHSENIEYLPWKVCDAQTGRSLGITTFNFVRSLSSHAEIGVMLAEHAQNNGIGSDVLKLFISIAFKCFNLNALLSYTENENYRAQQVLKNHGFSIFKSNNLTLHSSSGVFWRLPNKPVAEEGKV